ncbi:MAG: ribosome biogenesis GTPase YlqF [Firmicutes bacterium HGW-Firmicutes-9]|jgi:ribosome biogenesis GTPase A|nr:MAG: ribosome biogenesis GTPase YlqF [Firmicutes bacterium HGW-Firmicutes-9]
MPAINWYPGHMTKTRRMLQENLKMIDVVVEILDARAPLASRNPDFDDLFAGKARVVLLNKSDLADSNATKRWITHFNHRGIEAAGISATGGSAKKIAVSLIEKAAKPRVNAMKLKGVNKVVRCMIVGIPNVGKSTLINRIAGQNRAEVGDKPGVTRGKQWVKITPYLELMDTPGMLWPKLEDQELAKHLAFLGSIKDEVMDSEELALDLLAYLNEFAPAQVAERYSKITAETPKEELLNAVCRSRGFLLRGGELDTERAAHVSLDEFRAGKVARITLEQPGAVE